MRSFTEASGLKNSSLPISRPLQKAVSISSFLIFQRVAPMVSRMLSLIFPRNSVVLISGFLLWRSLHAQASIEIRRV